ncbi:MAG: 4Fe-4S dicluster domain-containing protein [Clostridia bacterium]|nr:4Fe-4S dicluster domain-containing protein [Clostridia bacterium]
MALASCRGVYIKGCRKALKNADILELRNSEEFCIALKPGMGSESEPIVSVGQNVKTGSVLAKPVDKTSAFIYSPVSGNISKIEDKLNSLGQHSKIITIVPSAKDVYIKFKALEKQTRVSLFGRLVESGSIDTFGKNYPTYSKYINRGVANPQTLIINLYDSDGYVCSNSAIARNYAREVAGGAVLFSKLLDFKKVVFVGVDQLGVISNAIKEHLLGFDGDIQKFTFVHGSKKYPFDEEHLLAYKLTKTMVKIDDDIASKGMIVENAQACYNFYNAVYNNTPTTATVYTISGDNFVENGLAWVKNGLNANVIFDQFGIKDKEKFASFAIGGAMSGVAQIKLETNLPISKNAIVAFGEKYDDHEIDCINCGRCSAVCPTRLEPMALDTYALEHDYGRGKKYGAEACINCGVCSYVCPSKRNLAQRISDMKDKIKRGETL